MADADFSVVQTDADGAFEMIDLAPGSYGLYVGEGTEFSLRMPRDIRQIEEIDDSDAADNRVVNLH